MMRSDPSVSTITAGSSRDWMNRRQLPLWRYLRHNHHRRDHGRVKDLVYWFFPDQGKKLIQNDRITPKEKLDMLLKWIVHSPQITCLILGDQRMGKDALVCRLFELIVNYCEENNLLPPRIVTLGNVKCPPFVADKDMYFSFKDIPFGTANKPVYIYCSELEVEFPARDYQTTENKLFSVLEGTMGQNHQKLFGCVKLASKVDISILRSCNLKIFKYISPEKLDIEGVERVNILTELGRWFLPKDVNDKSQSLLAFDNNLLTAKWKLPTFWSQEYSEQFNGQNISKEKIFDFVRAKFDDKEKITPTQIIMLQTMVYQKFRVRLKPNEIKSCFNFTTENI
jgi:hypothetical protein